MKSIERDVSDYIHTCAVKGVHSMYEIQTTLENDIVDIQTKLSEAEPLRIKLYHLQKIQEKIASMMQSEKMQSNFDDESKEMEIIEEKVIKIIDLFSPLSNRSIILKFMEENKEAYGSDAKIIRVIKRLADKGILDKNSDRDIVKGSNWKNLKLTA